MWLGVIRARIYFPKWILPISLDPHKSHDPQKSILLIFLMKIHYSSTLQKSLLTKQNKKKNLTSPIKPKPKTQLRPHPKIRIFDPNNKINQPNLFLDLLSKSEDLKVNYEKICRRDNQNFLCIIKRSTSGFSIKGDWIWRLENYCASSVSVIPRPNTWGGV